METIEDCPHPLIDEYSDGGKECISCGVELGMAGLMLRHLGIEVITEGTV